MAYIEAKIFSTALGMATEVAVVIPQRSTAGEIGTANKEGRGLYKCLYLLHGLSDDQTIWMRRTSIERYATKYGIAVVMPRGDRSFYADMKYGPKYFTYITEELPEIISDLFPISTRREDTVIGGLSMGGYGALKSALRKPEKYSKVIALSSVADIVGKKKLFDKTLIPIYGEELDIPESDDIFALAESLPEKMRPEIFMAVGLSDFLYTDNVKLRDRLRELGYDLTYVEAEGIHSWDFWDEHIVEGLEFAFGEKKN